MGTDKCLCQCLPKEILFLCKRCARVSAWDSTANEIRTDDNYKAAEKKTSIFNNRNRGGGMTSKMLLFAFFVQLCRYDMLEMTIITAAYEVFAYWSSCIDVFCFPFSLSLISSRLKSPVHSPSPSLLCFEQQLLRRWLSVVAAVRSTAILTVKVPDQILMLCTQWHSGLFWSQIRDGLEVEWHASTFLMKLVIHHIEISWFGPLVYFLMHFLVSKC